MAERVMAILADAPMAATVEVDGATFSPPPFDLPCHTSLIA
jgi:hypothetical protein